MEQVLEEKKTTREAAKLETKYVFYNKEFMGIVHKNATVACV